MLKKIAARYHDANFLVNRLLMRTWHVLEHVDACLYSELWMSTGLKDKFKKMLRLLLSKSNYVKSLVYACISLESMQHLSKLRSCI